MTTNKLKQDYENACNAYLKTFVDKHDYEYDPDYWVGNSVGTVISIADYYVDMETIRIDIDRNAPVDEFVKWYDYSLRLGTLDCKGIPNYDNWLRKCPIKSEAEIKAIEEAHKQIEKLKKEFEKMCQEDYKYSKTLA